MTGASVTAHVYLGDANVTFHCEQSDGQASFRVEHGTDEITVYLVGTAYDLAKFGAACAEAATAWMLAQPAGPAARQAK